jgi:hypothetical protein
MKYVPEWVTEFERCGPWLEAALERGTGTHTIEDVFAGVSSGEMQLLYNDTAAMITTIHYLPRATNVHIFLTGGDMAGAKSLLHSLEEASKKIEGKVNISLQGRPGWLKSFLVDEGYESLNVVMTKEL